MSNMKNASQEKRISGGFEGSVTGVSGRCCSSRYSDVREEAERMGRNL
jgi:hypothetical protein